MASRRSISAALALSQGLRAEPAWKSPQYRDFTGGENLQSPTELLAPNQVVTAQNCVITADGRLETREGKTALSAALPAPIISLHRYSKEDGTRYLLAQSGLYLYAVEWDGSSLIEDWGVAIKELTAEDELVSVVWKDKIFLTNGVDNPFTFDGAAIADIGGDPPKSRFIAVYAGCLWLVDVTNPSALRYSTLEDPDDWPLLNIVKVRDGDGDVITGISPQPQALMIFKENTVWPLFGTNSRNFELARAPISKYIGCVAPRSLLDDGLFLAKDNLYRFTVNSVEAVSLTHTDAVLALPLEQRRLARAIPHPVARRALINLPDAAYPDQTKTLCLDARYAAFTTWINMNAGCFCVADDRGDSGALLIGGEDGKVYVLAGDTDDGEAIETRIKTAYEDHGSSLEKEWAAFQPDIVALDQNGMYRFYFGYDCDHRVLGGILTNTFQQNILLWGVDYWGDAAWAKEYRYDDVLHPDDARGRRVSFEIVCSNRIRLNGYAVRYRVVEALI